MLQPKKPTLAEQLIQGINSKVETRPDVFAETSATNVANTSESQIIKANSGLKRDRLATLLGKTQEDKEIEALQQQQIQKEVARIPKPGSIEETHREVLNNPTKFTAFQDREERLNTLQEKGIFSRINNTIKQGLASTYLTPIFGAPSEIIGSIFYTPKDLFGSIGHSGIADPGRTDAEEKEYNQLLKIRNRELAPTLRKHQQLINEEHANNLVQKNILLQKKAQVEAEIEEQKNKNPLSLLDTFKGMVGMGDPITTKESELGKINKDLHLLDLSRKLTEETTKKINDFTEGNTSMWDGLLNSKRDLKSIGAHSLVTNHEVALVAEKLDTLVEKYKGDDKKAWGDLSQGEQAVMKSFGRKDNVNQMDLMKNNGWYHTADGVATSLVFVEGMALTGGIGGIAEGATEGIASNLTKKVLANTLENSFSRKLGLAVANKIIPGAVETVGVGLVSPSTYSAMARKYVGNTELVTDPDGTSRVLVRQGLYNKFMKEYDSNKRQLEGEFDNISSKKQKTENDLKRLDELKSDMENLDLEKETLTTGKDLGWGKAFAYGLTESMKEYASEKYVGELGELGAAKFAGSKLGKALVGSSAGKGAKYLNEVYNSGKDALNNTLLGKLSSKAMYHSGAGQIYHGVGGEVLEEIATQITPTVSENYTQQIKELANPAFYADIVSQTLMMSGGMATLGLASQVKNYNKNKEMYDRRKAIRQSYKMMDKAVNDADLAETIVMSTGGTGFSLADYERKISDLRADGKTEQANTLEQKKFYNMALDAIRTNTLDEFQKALDTTLKNHNDSKSATQYSAETVNNITLAKEKVADLKSTYDRYKDRGNVGAIVELASQKITNKQSLKQLNSEIGNQRALAQEEVQGFIDREKLGVSFTDIDELLERRELDEKESKKLEDFYSKLEKEPTPALGTYMDLKFAKENLEYANLHTMKEFNHQVSPNFAVEQEKIKAVQRQVQKSIEFYQENSIVGLDQYGQVKMTKDFLDATFNNIDTLGLDKKKLDQIKNGYLKIAEENGKAKMLQAIDRISALYQNPSKEAAIEQRNNPDPEIEEAIDLSAEQGTPEAPTEEAIKESTNILLQNTPDTVSATEDKLFDIDNENSVPAQLTNAARAQMQTLFGESHDTPAEMFDEQSLGDLAEGPVVNPTDTYALSPLPVDAITEDQIKGLKNMSKTLYEGLTTELGREPSFKEFVSHFLKYGGKIETEKFFDHYKLGWEANNFPVNNYQEVYNDLFEPNKDTVNEIRSFLQNIYGNTSTVETITEPELLVQTQDTLKEIEAKQDTAVTFTDENIPVKVVGGNRITNAQLKLGYNAIKYDEVQLPDGTWKRVTSSDEFLNLGDSFIDFRDLLNPDMYSAGDSLNVSMAPKDTWSAIKVNVGRDEKGQSILRPYSEVFAEKVAANPNYESTQEFIDTVPMFTYDNMGKPLSYIHETNWYNAWNVADPTKTTGTIDPNNISKSHAELIQEGKDEVSKLRTEILKGKVNKITISEKKEGAFFSRAKLTDENGVLLPLYTIAEANPQAEIVVQVGQGVLEQGSKKPFENSKRKIINKEEILNKGKAGHTWNLRRIGIDPVDGKETWRALMIPGRYPSDEQLETIKWAWSAFSFFDTTESVQKGKKVQVIQEVRKEFLPKEYQLTEEEANKIIKDIKDITGYNLLRFQDAQDFFKLFMQPKTGDSNAEFGRTIYGKTLNDFSQHTLNSGLNRKQNVALIKNGVVENTGKTYQEYLKNNLKTDVKSFNVGTEQNPVYATSIQPVINFSYATEESTLPNPPLELERVKQASLEALQELTGSMTEVDLLKEAKKLETELGFNFGTSSYAPMPMTGTTNLENIFFVTPGLNITQESHLINFVYNYITSAIDVKYKAKVNTATLLGDLKNSYRDIVGPSKSRVESLLENMVKMNEITPSAALTETINNYTKIIEAFNNIENYWNVENIKSHFESQGMKYAGQLGIIEKAMQEVNKTSDIKEKNDLDEEDAQERDLSQVDKNYAENSSLTENGKQKTTYRLRRFMSGITRVTQEGDTVKGFLGLPDYVNFNEVYDSIYQLLGSGVYIESDYETMKSKILEMDKAQPWVKELMQKFDKADAQLRKELVYNYRKHAVSMKFTMYSTGTSGASLQVYDTNANELTRVITNEWKNNFKTSPLVIVEKGQYSVNKEVAAKLLAQYNEWGTEGHLQPDSVVRGWMENFGLSFSDKYWNELKSDGFMNKGKVIPYALIFKENTPIGLLAKYLNKIVGEADTNFEESENNHPFKDMQGIIKSLAKGESKYTSKILSKSFRDAGKSISGITNPTYVTDRLDDLKRAALGDDKTLIENLQSLSISSNSILLELLTEDPEFASKLSADHLGLTALKEYGRKSNNFSSITDLNNLDHDVTKLGMFQDTQQGTVNHRIEGFTMRIGRMFLPTMSDKTQMLTLSTGVFNFMQESNIAFEVNPKGSGLVFSNDLKELVYQKLIAPELKRISNFHKNVKATNIKDYDEAAQLFNFIPALNNVKDENGDRIIEHLALLDPALVEQRFKKQLIDTAEEVIHSLVAQKMELWRDFKETNDKGEVIGLKFFDAKYLAKGKGNLEDKFETGTYDFVLNSMLTNADMFTVIAGDPALYSQKKLFKDVDAPFKAVDDSFYTTFSEKQGVNIGKRLALLVAPGQTLADSKNKQYKQVFLKDTTDISANSEYLVKLYYGSAALNEPLYENSNVTVKQAIANYPASTAAQKEVIRKGLQDKFEKIGDYFDIESTDAQEYTTVKEHIGILLNQGRLSEELHNTIQNKLKAGEVLTKEELGIVLQPIKPVYTGQIFDKTQDVSRTVYIKSSSFPLLPQLTAGTKLEGLRAKLEELEELHGMPVRASYQTANKVGAMKTAIDPLSSESLKEIDAAMLTLDRNNFRIQQDVPFKSDMKAKDTVAMGTQFFKLLFGDGMLNETGFVIDGKELTGQELYDYFNNNFENLINLKKKELYKELGLDSDGNVLDPKESTKKLQDLLQKEAIKRDYPIQDIKGLEIDTLYDKQGNPYYEFKVPLWLASNSNRYEALLNAIVTNRIMAHKLPGNSFVAGSENGFQFSENLEGIDKSRIIFLNGWNGKELQGVSTTKTEEGVKFSKAQVFVPSKFKNSKGKLIDLFEAEEGAYKYLVKNENGSLGLKEGMIDEDLLSNFSFRTPTSAHVSGSVIEIAGILPPEVGDLMIVPKNFTKQKGLDFDVDKENVYQLHHVQDIKTGKIEELSEAHKERALKNLRKLVKSEDELFESEIGVPSMDVFYELIRTEFDDDFVSELQDSGSTFRKQIETIEDEYDLRLAENAFIKTHVSVFTNSKSSVQRRINKVLSMDFARQQADFIEGLNAEAKVDALKKEMIKEGTDRSLLPAATQGTSNTFTILSDEYQKQKMNLGSAGKLAIGVYSNNLTLHALTQQTSKEIRMTEPGENGPTAKNVTIGSLTASGILGKEMTLDGGRSIAEVFAEKQNTATDNEKEQVLGRVNINGTTIGVDSLLTLLGFDVDDKGNSVSYMLLSQPILKQYVEALNNSKGITADFQKDAAEVIINNLVVANSNGAISYKKGEFVDVETGTAISDFADMHSSKLTGDNLVNGIKFNGEDKTVQLATLAKFLELDAYAKSLAKSQSLLDTNNLGKSIIESNGLYDNLKTFADNSNFSNVGTLIGDFVAADENTIKPEGYYLIGDYYVKPTTPQGQIVVNGLVASQKLWSDYFPYNNVHMAKIMDTILKEANIDVSNKFKVIEAKQEIIEETRKFLFSWMGLGLYDTPASQERARLFMDTTTNTSLANYLNTNSAIPELISNKLLNRFTYEIETNGKKPSLVKYNNTVSDSLDEKYLYNSLAELMIEDKKLPDWNGKPFSTRQLAQELITYSYVEGGVQEAVQFIKYVPVEYLSEVGLRQNGQFISANTLLQRINVNRNPNVFADLLGLNANKPENSVFVKQYFQHHPEKATKLTADQIKTKVAFAKDKKSFILNEEATPKFVSTSVKTKSKLKQDKVALYEHLGSGKYQRIDTLGINGMNEYELGNMNATSLISSETIVPVEADTKDVKKGPNGDTAVAKTGDKVSSILTSIATSTAPAMERYKLIAETLLPMANDEIKVAVVDMAKERGRNAGGEYDSVARTVFIDSSLNPATNVGVFIHELIHSMSLAELKKYYTADAEGFFTAINNDAPTHVVALHNVWNEFRKNISDDLIASTKQKTLDMKAGKNVSFTVEEREIGYAAVDIFEFMSVALESKVFQQKMSEIPYERGTLWDKFKEVVVEILKTLNPNITSGSVAEASLKEVLNFIEQENQIHKENAIFASLSAEELGLNEIDSDLLDNIAAEEMLGNNTQGLKIDEESTEGPTEALTPNPEINPFNQNC